MGKVLFLIGPHASGKTYTSMEYINKNSGVGIIDTGPIMREIYLKSGYNKPINEWVSDLETKYGPRITSKIINERINYLMNSSDKDNFIIIGFRSLEGIDYVINDLNIKNYSILYLDCDKNLLYDNYCNREKGATIDEYESRLDYEYSLGLSKMRNIAILKDSFIDYHYRISNNDSLLAKIDKYFKEDYNSKIDLSIITDKDYIWPVEPKYRVIEHDNYGLRPIHMILGKPRFHSGFDITVETMTPIIASACGIVIASGLDEKIVSGLAKWNERYGNKVEIIDPNGRRLVYAHLRETLVKVGQYIEQGDVLGLSGCSGGARIPHLHFEVRTHDTSHSGETNTINPVDILPPRDLTSLNGIFMEKPYDEVWQKFLENPWGTYDKDIPYSNCKKLIR